MKQAEKMIIREYIAGDREGVLDLHRLAMEAIGIYGHEPHWNEDLDTIETTYGGERGIFLVGTINGKIVAMGAYKRTAPGHAEIKRMRVMPGMQGKGLGKKIYTELEKRAVKSGIRQFTLETSALQENAQSLYLSVGFKKTGKVEIDGSACILYEKDLKKSDI